MGEFVEAGQITGESSRRVLVLGNPYNGHVQTREAASQLTQALEQAAFEPVLCWDRDRRADVLSDVTGYRCLIVIGGDGSVREVLNALPRNGGPVGLPVTTLPAGNENLFARHLGVDGDPVRLVGAIERLRTRRLDLGEADGEVFTLMLTAGFDAEVVHRVSEWRHRGGGVARVSRRTYVPHIADSLRRYRYPKITIDADGQTYTGSHVLLFNLPQYGGPLDPAPDAQDDDGALDYLVLERRGVVRLLGYAQALLRGSEGRDIHRGRARRVRITCDGAAPLQADGDPVGHAPCDVRVLPQAMTVIDSHPDPA